MSLPAKKGGALIGAMAISTALATGGMNGLPIANATCFQQPDLHRHRDRTRRHGRRLDQPVQQRHRRR
jgi:hypothetical protein